MGGIVTAAAVVIGLAIVFVQASQPGMLGGGGGVESATILNAAGGSLGGIISSLETGTGPSGYHQ